MKQGGAPTMVINGFITPLTHLINGFHWGYITLTTLGVTSTSPAPPKWKITPSSSLKHSKRIQEKRRHLGNHWRWLETMGLGHSQGHRPFGWGMVVSAMLSLPKTNWLPLRTCRVAGHPKFEKESSNFPTDPWIQVLLVAVSLFGRVFWKDILKVSCPPGNGERTHI